MILNSAVLIGCGRMGKCHSAVLKKLGITLVGAADVNESSAIELTNSWSLHKPPESFLDSEQLLLKHKPDLALIATTACSHSRTAHLAITAGVKHILIEKPLATSLSECKKLINASQNYGTRIAVNHQMRYLPQYTIPKTLLLSKEFQEFTSMHVSAGNFGLAMNGTHYFEAFRFLADEAPTKVSAWFDTEQLTNPRGRQFQDVSGCIRVTTASGKRLYIDASANQGHGVQVTYMGRNGRITIDELAGTMTTVLRKPDHCEAPTSRYGMPVVIEEQKIKPVELVDSTKAVLEALIKGENHPTLQDATLAVKTLVAAYHSHRNGGISVKLADIPDDDPEVFPWA